MLKTLNLSLLKNTVKTIIFNNRKNFSTAIQEQTVKVKGQTINYVKTGQGDKAILCFPGALGTIWSDFKPQIINLDKSKFTIVAWDPPGYGHSRPPERIFNIKFYENDADTAVDFMQQLGINKFSLLGWSDGGISSMIISAKYPNLVEKLVIWGANSYIIPEEIESYEKIRSISKWSDKMKAPLIKLYAEEGLQKMWNDWCDAVGEMYKKNNGNICGEVLDRISCPTLVLHGDKDPMVAAEHPDHLASKIKGARLHRFPEGKHNIHLRFAGEFNNIFLFRALDPWLVDRVSKAVVNLGLPPPVIEKAGARAPFRTIVHDVICLIKPVVTGTSQFTIVTDERHIQEENSDVIETAILSQVL